MYKSNKLVTNVYEIIINKSFNKIVLTNSGQEDISNIHSEFYGNDVSLNIIHHGLIYDKITLGKYLQQVPIHDQHLIVKKLILLTNNITLLIYPDCSKIIDKNESTECIVTEDERQCMNFIVGIDLNTVNYASTTIQSPNIVQNTTLLYELKWILQENYTINTDTRYIFFNKGYNYLLEMTQDIFPEFQVNIYENFPSTPVAEDMFYFFQKNNAINLTVVEIIRKIHVFFDNNLNDTSFLSGETGTCNTIVNDIYDHKRYMIEFIETKCSKVIGKKIKSSVLFEKFKYFYTNHPNSNEELIPFDKLFNQTSFSKFMKDISGFESKRESDGMHWVDLQVISNNVFISLE